MSTIGIVATSVICGIFCILLLLGIALLVWLAVKLHAAVKELKAENAAVQAETRTTLTAHQSQTAAAMTVYHAEMKAVVDSSKASFTTIRNETKAMLEAGQQKMEDGIKKINAEALQSAAARSIEACLRLEKVIGIFQQLILNNEERVTHEYGPEDFAPESTTFGGPPSQFSISENARLDAEAEQETASLQESRAD